MPPAHQHEQINHCCLAGRKGVEGKGQRDAAARRGHLCLLHREEKWSANGKGRRESECTHAEGSAAVKSSVHILLETEQ